MINVRDIYNIKNEVDKSKEKLEGAIFYDVIEEVEEPATNKQSK